MRARSRVEVGVRIKSDHDGGMPTREESMSKNTQRAFIESLPDWKRARLEALIANAQGYGKHAAPKASA